MIAVIAVNLHMRMCSITIVRIVSIYVYASE